MTTLHPSRAVSIALIAAIVTAPSHAYAQRAGKSTTCASRPTDAWVKRQSELFDDSRHDWSDDAFRTALLQAAGIAAPLTAPAQTGVEIAGREPKVGPTADAMRDRLRQLAKERTSVWPTRSVVGAAGTHAVYLLSLSDTGLARAALHRMMEAGPAESPATDIAVFEDHMRLVWGRKQIYGTQFTMGPNGTVVLSPMEDSTHADLRREDAGLPPFALGLCYAKQSAK